MEKVRKQMMALDVQEQQQLMVDVITDSTPELQLRLLLPCVTYATSYVKWRLVNSMQGQDTPDLLQLLPPELQVAVLSYLDGQSLLRAFQVSRTWNCIIKNHKELWIKQCQILGVNMSIVPESVDWHKVYIASLRQKVSLQNGMTFSERFMQLQNCKKAVKAVDYQDGFLCTVSEEDYINIWQFDMNIPVLTFPVDRVVSCIKFRPNTLLICGHFVGTLTSWNLSSMSQGRCTVWDHSHNLDRSNFKKKFKLHAGPVLSCDFSEELDLLVSGGADDCLKLWCLSSGLQVMSMANQDHWVLRVILIPDLSLTSKNEIVYKTRESVKKISWPSVVKLDEFVVKESDSTSVSPTKRYGMIEKITSNLIINLNEGQTNFHTPGLQFSSKFIGMIKQDLDEKHTNLCVYDIETFKLEHNIPLNMKVKKLLALGKRYALLLTKGNVLYSSMLVIIDIITTEIIGTRSVPHSKMTTPDGAQLVVGDVKWLDGLGVHLPGPAHSLPDIQAETSSNCSTSTNETEIKFISQDNRTGINLCCANTGNKSIDLQGNSMSLPKQKVKSDKCCSDDNDDDVLDKACVDASCCAHDDDDDKQTDFTPCECDGDKCKYVMSGVSQNTSPCYQQKQASFLVLASGVSNEPGRLYTLWWAQSRHSQKCKEE